MKFIKCTLTGEKVLETGIINTEGYEVNIINSGGFAGSDFYFENTESLKWSDVPKLIQSLKLAEEEWNES